MKFRGSAFTSLPEMALRIFDHPELFAFVVDHEIAFVAQLGDVPAQNPNAQGMKSTHRRLQRLTVIARGPFGMSLLTRCNISRAALLVKVTARMFSGEMP